MIALIDYGAGNVASVANALEALGQKYIITNNEVEICKSDHVIFPGVGEASYAIQRIHMLSLFNVLKVIKKPLLGICLGMQLLADFSTEGNISCLGIFPGRAEKFDSTKTKVPHMGWNDISLTLESKLFRDIKSGERFYFANSYYIPKTEHTTSTADNNTTFSASMEKGNYYGVQFHPEKSGDTGLKLLQNFIEL